MMEEMDRRKLFKLAGTAAGLYMLGCGRGEEGPAPAEPEGAQAQAGAADDAASALEKHRAALMGKVAVARNGNPYENTVKAIALMGGMKAFLPADATVVVKPNIAWNRPPSACTTTNPDVVRAVVEECFKAGAKTVEVYDRTCEDRRRSYARSGISDAAKAAGATVRFVEEYEFVETELPRARVLKKWPVIEGILKADAVINVPIAKDHDTATLTMAMKNLMGVMGGNRGEIHTNMGKKLADFSTLVVPTLNILDANSILVAGGPQGGTRDDIRNPRMVIAGVEAATVDTFAAANLPWEIAEGRKVAYLDEAAGMNLGELDPSKIHVIKG